MDENLAWKIVYIAAIFSLIVMGIAYYFIAPRESPFFTEEKMEKIAEFKSAHISGRKEGKKVWAFFAEEGWTTKDRETTYLYKVSQGRIYQDGELVVTDLTAPRAKAYRRSEIVEVFGPLHAYLDLGKISGRESKECHEWTKMIANYLKYIPAERRSEIEGNVKLDKKDSSIYAQKIIIDHDKKIADIHGEIRLERKDGVLRGDTMQYISDEERLEAAGHIDIRIKEDHIKTAIKSNHASFFTDIAKDMTIQGSLEVVQGKKLAIAQEGIYSQKKKELVMKGKVKAVFEKAEAILKKETTATLKSKEAKKILKEKTVLTSDELVFSTQTGDARASGSVFVSQKGREAKADRANYDDKKETLTLTGNVYMKKEKDWVSAKLVIVSIRDETFEAVGAVEAEFKL